MDNDIYPDDDRLVYMNKMDFEKILIESDYSNREKYEIKINTNTREVKVINKPVTLTYKESDMNKYLMNKESADLLYYYGLKLPSYYKDKSLKELQEALKNSQAILSGYKDSIKNVVKYDYVEGKSIASPKNKNPRAETRKEIEEHNILEIYNYNLDQLR